MMDEFIEECFGLTQSPDIVKALKTFTIKNIVRAYNTLTLERYAQDKKNILTHDYFDMLPGTILVHLDNNDIIGFQYDDNKDSIIVWYDTHQGVKYHTPYYVQELSNFMSYDDPVYSRKENWKNLIGNKLTKICILENKEDDIRYFDDAFQRAIILESEKENIVLSSLPEFLYPLCIIKKSQISQNILNKSKLIEL